MKIRTILNCTLAVALLTGPGPGIVPALLAQSNYGPGDNRLLLVFDTSSAMKKRLPAEDHGIKELFAITFDGQFWRGNSVGVWTFNHDLYTGEFALRQWTDHTVSTLPPELIAFLKKQRYRKDTDFDALIPKLNEVVRTSPRLTAIIFCDGTGKIGGVPWTDFINTSFKLHERKMEKARVPFVIVLRSQIGRDGIGRYVGCTVSSADSITLPTFPPLPRPPTPPAPVKELPPPPPPPPAPPLIIIGTNNPTTNQPPAPIPSPQKQLPPAPPAPSVQPNARSAPVPPAASPAPSVPLSDTNFVPPQAAPIQPTNAAVIPPQGPSRSLPPAAGSQTVPPGTSGTSADGLIAAGAALFIVAVAIVLFILRRARRRRSTSLITESLKKDKIHS